MVGLGASVCSVLEFSVVLFQIIGLTSLCLYRLLPPCAVRWVCWGRTGFILAMVGLGLAGALCGRQDSEFALFAGGTMTILLIGMTIGSGHTQTTGTTIARVATEANLAS